MTALRILAGFLGLALLIVLISSAGQTANFEDFRYETQALFDQPWAVSAVANLYAGFLLTAIIMIVTERSAIAGLLWAAPMLVLGNVWTAVWLVVRLPRIAALFKTLTQPGG